MSETDDTPPAGHAAAGGDAGRLEAFISYSHEDREFAARLRAALTDRGRAVWMDEQDIPGGSRWRPELERAIESADTFVFLVSPASIASRECVAELAYADGLNKRILPLRARAVDPATLPPALAARQLLPARTPFDDDFEHSLDLLMRAIDVDPEWLAAHTDWGRRALEWNRRGRDRGLLLAGSELAAAERWRREAAGKEPAPTQLHGEYIDASREAVTRRLIRTRAFVSVALIVAIGLAILAVVQRQIAVSNQHTAHSQALAASAESALDHDPELSTLLALAALKVRDTDAAEQALRDALAQTRILATLRPAGSHRQTVQSAQFSPDGRTILTAGADGTVRLWDAAVHRQTARLAEPGHAPVLDAEFSRDGSEIVTSSVDRTARVWDMRTTRMLLVLREPGSGSSGSILTASFSPDGREIVTASADGTARIWGARGGAQLGVITEPSVGPPDSAAFSPGGSEIVTAGGDGYARVWTATRRPHQLYALQEPSGERLTSAAFSPDASEIVTSSADGTARIWSTSTHALLGTLAEPTNSLVDSAAFGPDGSEVVTASTDGTARVWSATSDHLLFVLAGHSAEVRTAAFSPDAREVLTASVDGTAKIWNAEPIEQRRSLASPDALAVAGVAVSPDGTRLVTVPGSGGGPLLWNARTGRRIGPLAVSGKDGYLINRTEQAAAFTRDGSRIAIAGALGVPLIFDAHSRRLLAAWNPPDRMSRDITTVEFSPDGRRIVTDDLIGPQAIVWSVEKRRSLAVINEPRYVREPGSQTTDPDLVIAAAFDPGATEIAMGGSAGIVRIRSASSGRQLAVLRTTDGAALNSVAFSPRGDELVAAGDDGVAWVWSLTTHRLLFHLSEPGGSVLTDAEFNDAGTQVLTASQDGTARIWSATARGHVQLAVFSEPGGAALRAAEFTADGREVVTASDDGTARIWSTELAGSLAQIERIARRRVTRGLTATERRTYAVS